MAALFAVTTPLGVAVGIGIRTTYNANSATALGVQGTFESVRIMVNLAEPRSKMCNGIVRQASCLVMVSE